MCRVVLLQQRLILQKIDEKLADSDEVTQLCRKVRKLQRRVPNSTPGV